MEAKVAHAVNHLGLVANGWLAEGDSDHLLCPCVFVLILESDRPAGTWCWLPLTGFDSGEPVFHRLYHWLSNLGFPRVSGTQFWCPHTSAQPNTLVEKKRFQAPLSFYTIWNTMSEILKPCLDVRLDTEEITIHFSSQDYIVIDRATLQWC